jgi:hypothetical protein
LLIILDVYDDCDDGDEDDDDEYYDDDPVNVLPPATGF